MRKFAATSLCIVIVAVFLLNWTELGLRAQYSTARRFKIDNWTSSVIYRYAHLVRSSDPETKYRGARALLDDIQYRSGLAYELLEDAHTIESIPSRIWALDRRGDLHMYREYYAKVIADFSAAIEAYEQLEAEGSGIFGFSPDGAAMKIEECMRRREYFNTFLPKEELKAETSSVEIGENSSEGGSK